MTTQEFIQQLEMMHVSSYNSEKQRVEMTNGMQVSHRVEISDFATQDGPLQMQLIVSYHGSFVMRWGAESARDNSLLAKCWMRLKNAGHKAEMDVDQRLQHEGYRLLMQGLQ